MEAKTAAKLAEQFDALSEALSAIAGTFRHAAGGAGGAGGDEPAPRRAAAKPSKPSKPAPTEDEVTEDAVREALKELAATKGKDKMAAVLASVGAGRLPEVDESQYGELMEAIAAAMTDEEEEAPPPKAKAKAKTKKAPAVTYDQVEEAFRAVAKADKVAAKAILKEAGLAKLSDIDTDDAEALAAVLAACTSAGDDDDDDDLV